MEISQDALMALVGRQTVEITVLRSQVAQLTEIVRSRPDAPCREECCNEHEGVPMMVETAPGGSD